MNEHLRISCWYIWHIPWRTTLWLGFLAYFTAPSESDGPDKFHLGLTYHTLKIPQGGKLSYYGKVEIKVQDQKCIFSACELDEDCGGGLFWALNTSKLIRPPLISTLQHSYRRSITKQIFYCQADPNPRPPPYGQLFAIFLGCVFYARQWICVLNRISHKKKAIFLELGKQ